jgi:uncharacterized SAM-binding protein YcdF (DUF218 family)
MPHLPLDDLPAGPLQIVVLGTGFNPDPELPANSRVGGTFLARLLEGIRILRARPESQLIVSVAGETPAEAKVQFWTDMKPLLGIESADTVLLTTAESTLDEAQLVKPLNNGQPLVLATSAGHLPRAVPIFADEGLQVLPTHRLRLRPRLAVSKTTAGRLDSVHRWPWQQSCLVVRGGCRGVAEGADQIRDQHGPNRFSWS